MKQIAQFPLIFRDKGSLRTSIIDESFRAAGLSYNCTMVIETSEALNKAVTDAWVTLTPIVALSSRKQTNTQSRDKRIVEI